MSELIISISLYFSIVTASLGCSSSIGRKGSSAQTKVEWIGSRLSWSFCRAFAKQRSDSLPTPFPDCQLILSKLTWSSWIGELVLKTVF